MANARTNKTAASAPAITAADASNSTQWDVKAITDAIAYLKAKKGYAKESAYVALAKLAKGGVPEETVKGWLAAAKIDPKGDRAAYSGIRVALVCGSRLVEMQKHAVAVKSKRPDITTNASALALKMGKVAIDNPNMPLAELFDKADPSIKTVQERIASYIGAGKTANEKALALMTGERKAAFADLIVALAAFAQAEAPKAEAPKAKKAA